MSNKGTNTRTSNACRAMRAIGIKQDKVMPVLENLIILYDKNWALIEEENYRVLADAIFDKCELEAEKLSKKNVKNEAEDYLEEEAQANEEPERPLKRLRPRPEVGQTSSLNTSNASTPRTPLVRPKKEPEELSETHLGKLNDKKGIVESPQHNVGKAMTKPTAITRLAPGSSKGKQPISSNMSQESASSGYGHMMKLRDRHKELKVEHKIRLSSRKNKAATHALIKHKDDPIINEMQHLEDSDVIINTVASNGGDPLKRNSLLRENYTHEPASLQSVTEKETAEGTATFKESKNNGGLDLRITEKETAEGTATFKESKNNGGLDLRISSDSSSSLEMASSASGEVKITLSYNLAPGRPRFNVPTLETVLKSVEDKYLKAPKSLEPKVSITSLLRETCERFLKLPPSIDSTSKSSIVDAKDATRLQSGSKVTQPKSIVTSPPLNGSNGGPKLDVSHASDETVINSKTQENCAEEMNVQDVVDIAKGNENVVITLVNEVNDEPPPSFYYIPQNTVFQNAYMNVSLARTGDDNCCESCSGDCLSLSIPCACSYETGGEYAYTADGLVKEELLNESISMNRDPDKHCQFYCKECPLERSKCEDIIEPCQGHLVRKFIKECWRKCGCNKQCGNRVVQRGITRKLQVFMTKRKGWGLRTLEDLPKGAFVCEYVGEVLTNAELFERVLRNPEGEKRSYPVLLDADWCAEGVLKDEEALCLDATYYGNVARFINHKCHDSNLVEIPVEVETPDHHYYHLAFFTTRKVKAMEELTWDYGIDFDDHDHPIKAFRCQCGSKFCRNIKRKSRSRR